MPRPSLVQTLVLLAVAASSASAQADYTFFHGAKDFTRSGFVVPADNDGLRRTESRIRRLTLPTGSKVCVNIVNAHPVNYSYSLGTTVDSTGPSLPDLKKDTTSALYFLFQAAAGKTAKNFDQAAMDSADAALKTDLKPIAKLLERVGALKQDLDEAKEYAQKSDIPERLQELNADHLELSAGYRFGKYGMTQKLPKDEGRFRDPDLAKTFAGWVKATRDDAAVKGDKKLAALVDALDGYVKSLIDQVQQLRKAYAEGDSEATVCGVVGAGVTTFELKIAKKDTTAAKRDAGTAIDARIVVEPSYEREAVSIHPLAVGVLSSGVSSFSVDAQGVLRAVERKGDMQFRIGALFDINLLNFGSANRIGLGAGIGAASGGTAQPLSDVFFSVIVSFMDKARVGLGIGASWVPTSIKGGIVDQPFSLEGKKLDDLIERSPQQALYLAFILPARP
jgi:hypothetical protein